MILSKIISTAVEKGMLIVKILASGSKDVKTVFNILPFGIDSNPVADYRAIYTDTAIDGEKILIGVINRNVLSGAGETRIYSTDQNGVESVAIKLTSAGNIEIGGNTDHAVKYSALETQFNELNDKFNALVSAFNQHMHATAATGAPSTPTPIPSIIPAEESDADITGAKINNILTS